MQFCTQAWVKDPGVLVRSGFEQLRSGVLASSDTDPVLVVVVVCVVLISLEFSQTMNFNQNKFYH